MKKIISFIGYICLIVLSAGLIVLGIHWGLAGLIPYGIVFAIWKPILNRYF